MAPNASPAKHAQRESERQGDPVETDFVKTRQGGGSVGHEQSYGAPCERQADHAGGDRDQHAFGEEVARDSGAPRAERPANGHVALSCLGADQEEVGDIRAGDQQHEPHRGEQDPERPRDASDCRLLQRPRRRKQPDVRPIPAGERVPRIRLWQVRNQPVQLGARVLNRRAVPQPCHPGVREDSEPRRARDRIGNPHVNAWIGERIRGRHDADHRRRHAAQDHRPAEDARVAAVPAPPEPMR